MGKLSQTDPSGPELLQISRITATLRDWRVTPNQTAFDPQHLDTYLDTRAVAQILDVTQRTVQILIMRGYLPASRLGPPPASWRVALDDLRAFLAQYRNQIAELAHPDLV